MMVNKTFIDMINELKRIINQKKTPRIIKSIKIYRTMRKSYKTIENAVTRIDEIKPVHIADFVAFLELARTSNLYNKDFIHKDVTLAYEFNMDNSENYTHVEGSCLNDNGIKYYYTYTAVITDDDEDNWYISDKCFKIVKGVGITGDTIGDFENTVLVCENKRVKSINVISGKDLYSKTLSEKEFSNAIMGAIFINLIMVGVSAVFATLTDEIFMNKKFTA